MGLSGVIDRTSNIDALIWAISTKRSNFLPDNINLGLFLDRSFLLSNCVDIWLVHIVVVGGKSE